MALERSRFAGRPFRTPAFLGIALAAAACTRTPPNLAARARQVHLPCEACNVVLVTIDALRNDALECDGGGPGTAPAICGLAGQGVRFDRAVSAGPVTWVGMDGIMTGPVPAATTAEAYAARVLGTPALAERLLERGYATAAFHDHPGMARPPEGRAPRPLQRGFDTWENRASPGGGIPTSRLVTDDAAAWIERHRAERFFLWTHLFDPHEPYVPEDPPPIDPVACARVADGRIPPGGNPSDVRGAGGVPDLSAAEVRCLRDLYRAEVSRTDALVGDLLRRLDELGLGERTLVIVTADHGEAFLEHGRLEHQSDLFEESIRVPLVVRAGRARSRAHRIPFVTSTTLVPRLVLDALAAVPTPIPEIVLARTYLFKEPDTFAAIDDRFKVITGGAVPGGAALYDLQTDPGETRPLADHPRLAALRREVLAWIAAGDAGGPVSSGGAAEAAAEREAQMRRLGYVR